MKYGFIGCGNMGGAIARALSKSTTDIALADRSGKGKVLAAELGITYSDNASIAASCNRIFLGVKPHMMRDCLAKLQDILIERKPLLITMAAGLEIRQIEEFAGTRLPVIRIMPNTPTAIGKGVIQYCCNDLVDDTILADWLADMTPCGLLDALDESLIDAASAVSGSGPAYVYLFIEAMADGGVLAGMPRPMAVEFAAQTVLGAAKMVLETGQHPGALKDAVCSPGGTTIEAIRNLEAGGFRSTVMEAVIASAEKSEEMTNN